MNTASGVRTRRSDLIRYIRADGHSITIVCHRDSASSDLRRMGVTLVHWRVSRRGMAPISELRSMVGLRNILARIRPDIILCFTPKAILYGSIAGRLIPKGHVFSVFAGLGYLFSEEHLLLRVSAPLVRRFFRTTLKNNRVVFFQNGDDLRDFISHSIVPAYRARLLNGSGVNTARFVPERLPHSRSETVFLMIARLIASKGVLDYIRAAEILKHERQSIRARLLGPFDDHPSALSRATIEAAHAHGTIEYLGTTDDVRPYLDDADVFVLPSYYREGTPRSTLEAMAMAKPVITTDSPGCRETVIDNVNGFLIPPRNPRKLAAAMTELVGDIVRIGAMGRMSRQFAVEKYDVQKVNRQLWQEVCRTAR